VKVLDLTWNEKNQDAVLPRSKVRMSLPSINCEKGKRIP
jgi:hypothetical protein